MQLHTGLALCLQVRPNILELQLQGRSKVNPHYLESYRTALQAAMLLPFGRRGTPHDRTGVLALGQQPVLRAILAAEGCAASWILLRRRPPCVSAPCFPIRKIWRLLTSAPMQPCCLVATGWLPVAVAFCATVPLQSTERSYGMQGGLGNDAGNAHLRQTPAARQGWAACAQPQDRAKHSCDQG